MNIHLNLYPTNGIWTLFSKSKIALLTDQQQKIGMVGVAILGCISFYMIGHLIKRCWVKVDTIDTTLARISHKLSKNSNDLSCDLHRESLSPSRLDNGLERILDASHTTPHPTSSRFCEKYGLGQKVDINKVGLKLITPDQAKESSDEEVNEIENDRDLKSSPVKIDDEVVKQLTFEIERQSENDHFQSNLTTPNSLTILPPISTKKKTGGKSVKFNLRTPEQREGEYCTPLRNQIPTPGFEKKLFALMDDAYHSTHFHDSVLNDMDYSIAPFLSPKGRDILNSYKKSKEVSVEWDFNISQFLNTSMPFTPHKIDVLDKNVRDENKILDQIDVMIASEENEKLKKMLEELRDVEEQALRELDMLFNS